MVSSLLLRATDKVKLTPIRSLRYGGGRRRAPPTSTTPLARASRRPPRARRDRRALPIEPETSGCRPSVITAIATNMTPNVLIWTR
jgi:hypothetical protein